MVTIFFDLALYGPIQSVLPANLCGERGYFRTMLRTALSKVQKGMNFFHLHNRRDFLRHSGRYDESSRCVQIFRKYAKGADLDKNPRSLPIKAQEQVDGMECLLEAAKKCA